jgi:serine/threonine-protein kinase
VSEETKQCTACGRKFADDALFCPKDGSALVPIAAAKGRDAFIGREILGHIQIKSLIGAGAMGRVYRAYQKGIDRDVAVKILHRDLAQNPDLVARFLREAKVASRLAHPNVVSVLLAGQLEDGTMYLVMEFLDGISLHSALLASGGGLPIPRALHIALQVCDAVGEAHKAGVVHRDVKPENVMLVQRGDDPDFAKVLDFGIARLAGKDGHRTHLETQAGLVFGTARYLSPEGARGEPVGPASDVYALATVIYQCLAGRTPFEHDSSVSLLVAQIHDPPPRLRSIPRAQGVHPAIEAAIMHNLAKNPAERDQDGHVFGRALLDASTSAGYDIDDLLHRPALARPRRSVSPAQVPVSEHTRLEAYGLEHSPGPPPSQVAIGANARETHPQGSAPIATPLPPLNALPTPAAPHVYHPSYSGRPPVVGSGASGAPGAPGPQGIQTPLPQPAAQERPRVAQTLDDKELDAARVAVGVGAGPGQPAGRLGNFGSTVATPLPYAQPYGQSPQGQPQATPLPHPAPDAETMLGTSTPSNGEDSLSPAGVPRRGRLVAIALVLALVAVSAAGIGAYRMGVFGPKVPATSAKQAEVDQLLQRAQAALDARKWDEPAGDNVLELTDQLAQKAPGETRTFQIRSQASDRIVREALDAKAKKDLPRALKLLQLAKRLSAPDMGLEQEIEDLEAEIAADPTMVGLLGDAGGVASKFIVSVKMGDGKDDAMVDETETLVATIDDGPSPGTHAPTGIDPKAHFHVSGPGLATPVEVAAKGESATRYSASYAFKQPGVFKIHFFARPDGFPLRYESTVKVVPRPGGAWMTPKPKPTTSTTGTTTTAPTLTTTGTWPTTTVPTTMPTGPGTIILTPDPVPLPAPGGGGVTPLPPR